MINNKSKKSCFSMLLIVLCATFILFTTGDLVSGYNDTNLSTTNSWENKIDSELWSEMSSKTNSDIIPIWVWLVDIVDYNAINNELKTKHNMDSAIFENEDLFIAQKLPNVIRTLQTKSASKSTNDTLSLDSTIVQNAISDMMEEYTYAKRDIIKREYTNLNQNFINNHVNGKGRKIISVSKFTPYMIIEATVGEIKKYAKLPEVESLLLYETEVLEECSDGSLNQIFADETVGTKSANFNNATGYKGRGVTIGVLEFGGGYFDTLNPQLSSIAGTRAKIIYKPVDTKETYVDDYPYTTQPDNQIRPHATYVTNIIVGQTVTATNGITYEGVAPMATVYQTKIQVTDSVTQALNDLAEMDCMVINISADMGRSSEYSKWDLAIDKFIATTGIVVVVSAGNINGVHANKFIPNMAKSLNAIVVGNADTKGSVSIPRSAPYVMQEGSSYDDQEFLPNKPDISAPGTNIGFVERNLNVSPITGTSFAAPIVTGIIAQIMEANPFLKSYGNSKRIKTILLAGAEYSKINPNRANISSYEIDDIEVGNYLREVSGAGLINAIRAINIAKDINSQTLQLALTNNMCMSQLTSLDEGERIRLVMTFYKSDQNTITANGLIDDIDISLIKSSQSLEVSSSNSPINNVEIIEYTVPPYGEDTYNCFINVQSMRSPELYAYVTWTKWRPGDVTGDGVTDNLDASSILKYDAGIITFSPSQLYVADVNKDGRVNNLDATNVLAYDSDPTVLLQ